MRKTIVIFSIILTWVMGACSSETLTEDNGGGMNPVPENTLRVFVGADGTTRATVGAEQQEGAIESLYLLFFEAKSDNSGQFVDYIEIANPAGSGNPNDINMMGTELQVTDAYHILAVANIHGEFGKHYMNDTDASAWMLQWVGKSESEVIADAKMRTRSEMHPESGQLLMSGRVEKPAMTFEVTLPLVRNQVRFDIINNLKGIYEVVSVQIRNVYAETKVWNDGTSDGLLDYSDNVSRIPLYHTYDNPNPNDDIMGGLYAFENQVPMPERNDRYTTCLIVELQKTGGSATSFYRINIAPDDSPQMLKRNNAYRVTLDNVGGAGDDTADDAYANANENMLDYTINAWDIGEEGLSITDGSSVLAAPYKTVKLPRADLSAPPAEGIVTTSFQIYTFTNNPNPVTPLTITEQSYSSTTLDEGEYLINATLDGNMLTISANAIPSGATVRGEIRLGYAGLRATIDVVQTDMGTDFLRVHLPDGGIPVFAPFGGIQSGLLRVEASDTWTARLVMPDGGFSFTQGAGQVLINSVTDAAMLTDGNKFRIWTLSPNTLETKREAFIIVSLDKDTENYSDVVHITQDVRAEIAIVPQHTVTFDGTGALAAIPNNADSTFIVRPSQTGEPAQFEAWEWVIEGANADKFDVLTPNHTTDVSNPGGNNVHVVAKGINTSGASYNAHLTVRLVARPTVATSIDLVQRSSGIDFIPNSLPNVPKTGGVSDLITIQADPSLEWELLSFTVADGSPSKDLVNHDVTLLDGDNNEITPGTHYSVSTDGFKVSFPKIYYPNRDIPVSATVVIGIVGSTLTKSITVNQTPLTATPFSVAAPQIGGYGNIHGGSYNIYFRQGIRSLGTVTTAISASSNMLYRNYEGLYAAYPWTMENNFRDTRDALTMIVSDEYAAFAVDALNNSNSPLKSNGFTIAQSSDLNASFNTSVSNTRIYQLLVGGVVANIPAVNTNANLYEDAVSTQVTVYPATTVPIIVTQGTNRAFLAIDPALGLIYLGESQFFDTPEGNPFLNNLLVYIKNAAMYGSHFTELLLDQGGQPAPWDAVWGANAGVSNQ